MVESAVRIRDGSWNEPLYYIIEPYKVRKLQSNKLINSIPQRRNNASTITISLLEAIDSIEKYHASASYSNLLHTSSLRSWSQVGAIAPLPLIIMRLPDLTAVNCKNPQLS